MGNFRFFAFRGKGASAKIDDFRHRGKSCAEENTRSLKAIKYSRRFRQRGKIRNQLAGHFSKSAPTFGFHFRVFCQRGKSKLTISAKEGRAVW